MLTKTDICTVTDNKIFDGKEIISLTPDDNGKLSFDTYIKSNFYENNFARLKPFLLSYRMKISNTILANLDSVVRVYTDGIICKNPITNVTLGLDIGNLKYEGSALCTTIFNSNNYYWQDEKNTILIDCLFKKYSYEETYNRYLGY